MAINIRVERGATEIAKLAQDLKTAGAKDLKKALTRELRAEVKPFIKDIRSSARKTLPAKGGLAAYVARSSIRAQIKTGTHVASVKVIGRQTQQQGGGEMDLRAMDRGRLRHPLFGRRGKWYTQTVKPNWFTKPSEEAVENIIDGLDRVLDDVRRRLES